MDSRHVLSEVDPGFVNGRSPFSATVMGRCAVTAGGRDLLRFHNPVAAAGRSCKAVYPITKLVAQLRSRPRIV